MNKKKAPYTGMIIGVPKLEIPEWTKTTLTVIGRPPESIPRDPLADAFAKLQNSLLGVNNGSDGRENDGGPRAISRANCGSVLLEPIYFHQRPKPPAPEDTTRGPDEMPVSGPEADAADESAESEADEVPEPTPEPEPAKPKPKVLPPLSEEDREAFYERLRNNVPEPLQKERRWVLLYDDGARPKQPIGGHPSADMDLSHAIEAHRHYKARGNNAPAIGYTTGGKMKYGEMRTIPPDPHCIWLDYDDLKDSDGTTIAAPEIITEIEKLREYGAYVEISMSGKGMHVCIPKPHYYDEHCKGVIRKSHRPEVFGNGQYVAVTGRIYGDKLPDWQAFTANPYAAVIVRDIITREGGWKKGTPPAFYGEDEADARVIAAVITDPAVMV